MQPIVKFFYIRFQDTAIILETFRMLGKSAKKLKDESKGLVGFKTGRKFNNAQFED